MSGGGGDAPPPLNGGQFLLQLLQKPPHLPPQQPPPPQNLPHDPAVAAVGPTIPFSSATSLAPSNGRDGVPHHHQHHALPLPPWPHHESPPLGFAPHVFFPQNPNPNFSSSPPLLPPPGFNQVQQQLNFSPLADDIKRSGFLATNPNPSSAHLNDQNLIFGTLHSEKRNFASSLNGNFNESLAQLGQIEGLYGNDRDMGLGNTRGPNTLEVEFHNSMNFNRDLQGNMGEFRGGEKERSSDRGGRSGWGKQGLGGSYKAEVAPPGFTGNSRSGGNKDYDRRRSFEDNVGKGKSNLIEMSHKNINSNDKDGGARRFSQSNSKKNVDSWVDRRVSEQLDYPGPPAGITLNSVSVSDIEESLMDLHGEDGISGGEFESDGQQKIGKSGNLHQDDLDDLEEHLVDSLGLDDLSNEKKTKAKRHGARDKDYRSDKRGKWILGQRARISKRYIECRSDIDRLDAPFLAIYESLIPAAEEKAKQKQLLTFLEKLVCKEWPDARLYVYGSCANSFGFSKSDIDICLAIQDNGIDKSEVLLKLAEILQSENLQNVQALTRARVPIVKLMDPITGISCDICINNVLAVINTKLLRDYARIDARLRQLAFIVKHWAKSRGVNETYQGTLSSYAYVLMCIHFLQQRKPAILPCLQEMEATYSVTVDDIECAYFDQVEKLYGFGSQNGESIAKLVWAFFSYWAYFHDYTNNVISVRSGHIMSKRAKDWTRRIGNDRHLICIEDPFETSHDLGRVVDKSSIRVLREEFERAAEIMQYDPDPCVKLFEHMFQVDVP